MDVIQKYKTSIFTLFLCFLVLPAFAKKKEFTRKIEKEFNVEQNGISAIENKYGNVFVSTWDKQKTRFEVTVKVKARSEEKAQEVFDRIFVDFEESSRKVSAKTSINSSKGGWFNWGNDSDDFQIHYKVFLPANQELQVYNKYGNISIPDMDYRVVSEVKYGNMDVGNINGPIQVYLGYGNGTIGTVKDAKIEIKYSNLDVDGAEEVTVNSKYSKLKFGGIHDLKTSSKYDTYRIGSAHSIYSNGKYDNFEVGEVSYVQVETKYSNYTVDRLTKGVNLDMSYGGFKARNVSSNFDEIRVHGRYTHFKFYMDGQPKFDLDIEGDYADIDLPSHISLSEKVVDNSHRSYRTRGEGTSKVYARLDYGGIRIE